jgi:hypothetical protein
MPVQAAALDLARDQIMGEPEAGHCLETAGPGFEMGPTPDLDPPSVMNTMRGASGGLCNRKGYHLLTLNQRVFSSVFGHRAD